MVHAYATNLGSLTLAVNSQRLLLEEPISNSIISLHPAITFAPETRPRPMDEVDGFSTSPDCLEVTWKSVDGIQATTSLHLLGKQRLKLTVRFTNTSGAPVPTEALHPLYVSHEGPAACALGMHELRTLGSSKTGHFPQLLRVQGKAILSDFFGVWFAPTGNPSLFLGTLESPDIPVQFVTSGARGKIVSMDISVSNNLEINAGESIEFAFLMALGNLDAAAEIRSWAEGAGKNFAPDGLTAIDLLGAETTLNELKDDKEEKEEDEKKEETKEEDKKENEEEIKEEDQETEEEIKEEDQQENKEEEEEQKVEDEEKEDGEDSSAPDATPPLSENETDSQI